MVSIAGRVEHVRRHGPLGDVAREIEDALRRGAIWARSGDVGARAIAAARTVAQAEGGAPADSACVAPGIAAARRSGGGQGELIARGERAAREDAIPGGFGEGDAGHREPGLAAERDGRAGAGGDAGGVAVLGHLEAVEGERRYQRLARLHDALRLPVARAEAQGARGDGDRDAVAGAALGRDAQGGGAASRDVRAPAGVVEALALAAAARAQRDEAGRAARRGRGARGGEAYDRGDEEEGRRGEPGGFPRSRRHRSCPAFAGAATGPASSIIETIRASASSSAVRTRE